MIFASIVNSAANLFNRLSIKAPNQIIIFVVFFILNYMKNNMVDWF